MDLDVRSDPANVLFDPSTTDDRHLFVIPDFRVKNQTKAAVKLAFGLVIDYQPTTPGAPGGPANGRAPTAQDIAALSPGAVYLPLTMDLGPNAGSKKGDLAFAAFAPEMTNWTKLTLTITDQVSGDSQTAVLTPGQKLKKK